jgi:hypothetical protein
MNYGLLESSHHDESNGGCFMSLRMIDGELLNET